MRHVSWPRVRATHPADGVASVIVCVGFNHRTAPLDLRARCAVGDHERLTVQTDLLQRFGHVVLVATCNRLEIYLDLQDGDCTSAVAAARRWFVHRSKLGDEAVNRHVTVTVGDHAVRHVVRVCCGLDSALVGEDEILGQVRRAWLDADLTAAPSPALNAAFRLAIATGRRARRVGGVSGWTSLADAAAAQVGATLASRASPRALVVGTGPMGLRAAQSLRTSVGTDLDMRLAGRTPARVARCARELDVQPIGLAELPAALDWADTAVVAVRARSPLIGSGDVSARPPDRPLLIVDLSLPRAVAATVGDLAGVTLTDLDRLGANSDGHGRWDAAGRARVEALVEQAVRAYSSRTDDGRISDTLVTLRLRAESVRRSHVARTLHRLPDLDDEARWRLDALSRAIVNHLLHEPTMRLRADTSGDVAAQVQTLFGLPAEA